MSHQQLALQDPEEWDANEPALPFMAKRHQTALNQLSTAFREFRPLAILIGERRHDASDLIERFLDGIEDPVTVIQVTTPTTDAVAGMRQIIQSIGFVSKDLSLVDLDNILRMFLNFQSKHQRRTVICIEETQENGRWMLDNVRRLVELEQSERYGLMIVLSGRPSLDALLREPPVDAVWAEVGKRITIAPFTLAETREYILRRVAAAGSSDIGRLFDFHSITLIHELAEGVPDAVSRLCFRSLQLADEERAGPVTTELVRKADDQLRSAPGTPQSNADTATMKSAAGQPLRGRLVAHQNGEVVQDLLLNRQRVLIGRDEMCDLSIPSRFISRHHAMVTKTPEGVKLLDLGSTNGTFVDGRRIKECLLNDGDMITFGDCCVVYTAVDVE